MAIKTKVTNVCLSRDMAPIYTLPRPSDADPLRIGNYIKATVVIMISDDKDKLIKEFSGEYKFSPSMSTKELYSKSIKELQDMVGQHILNTFGNIE